MAAVFPLTNSIPPTPQDIKAFCDAANHGDIDGVRNYLDQFGASIIDKGDDINARAITWAAFAGHTEIVKLLVDRGADINAQGTNGKPALTWAIEFGRHDTVEFLLKKGASLDVKDNDGLTPVDHVGRTGNEGMKILVDDRLMQLKEYEKLNGDQAKEAAAKAVTQTHLENLKKKHPPKLKRGPHHNF